MTIPELLFLILEIIILEIIDAYNMVCLFTVVYWKSFPQNIAEVLYVTKI